MTDTTTDRTEAPPRSDERLCSAGCGHPAWAHVDFLGCPRCACTLDWFDARVGRGTGAP